MQNSSDFLRFACHFFAFCVSGNTIYEKRNMIINENCEFMLMDKPNHNEHYTYFLTDEALEYQESDPSKNIDKELYMEHDEQILRMIIEFFNGKN